MKTLVLGVWYPAAANFGGEYFGSLSEQSDPDFDTLIISDHFDLPAAYYRDRLTVAKAPDGFTPAAIRAHGIRYAVENGYEALIFSDCDDYFSHDRVENARNALCRADAYVNNLTLVDTGGRVIKPKIYDSAVGRTSFTDMLTSNYFGLSNTAVNLGALPSDFFIPHDAIAVDWWIFSLLLLNQRSFVFDEDTVTFYRQHNANTVGMGAALTERALELGIRIKQIHYTNLVQYLRRTIFTEYEHALQLLLRDMNELAERVRDDEFRERYIAVINKNYGQIHRGWWSDILPLHEWSHYA